MTVREFFSCLVPVELLKGLNLTGRYFFRRKETVPYPEKRLAPKARFRGMFGYSLERCIDCHLCATACPINIIFIEDHTEVEEIDGKKKKKKIIDRYDIDVKRCMFCGLCEEACPTEPKSIWLNTLTYETATYERNEALYFTKERLESWEGVLPFEGVVTPAQGQEPGNLDGSKAAKAEPAGS